MATKRNSVVATAAKASVKANGKETNMRSEELIKRLEMIEAQLARLNGNAAPAKVAVKAAEEKPRFTEKQLAAQKAWGERQKAKAASFGVIQSPEYQELWKKWKSRKAKAYEAATKRAEKQALNKEGHKWVMEQLEKAAAPKKTPAKKASAKKVSKKS